QVVAQGQEEQGGDDVEAGVGNGDLAGGGGGQHPAQEAAEGPGQHQGAVNHAGDGEDDEQGGEDDGADDVEHQVDDGGALGVAGGADGGQHRGDAGADVLPEQDEHRVGVGDDAAVGQGLQDAHRGGRG